MIIQDVLGTFDYFAGIISFNSHRNLVEQVLICSLSQMKKMWFKMLVNTEKVMCLVSSEVRIEIQALRVQRFSS